MGQNRIRAEDLWKNVMAVEKYEGEKKLLTGASGDLSRPRRKRSFRRGSDGLRQQVRESQFELSFESGQSEKQTRVARANSKAGAQGTAKSAYHPNARRTGASGTPVAVPPCQMFLFAGGSRRGRRSLQDAVGDGLELVRGEQVLFLEGFGLDGSAAWPCALLRWP